MGPHSELRFLTDLPVSLPQTQVPGNLTSATLGPLSSSTMYTVRVTCFYLGGGSSVLTGHVTTRESAKSRLGCSWTVPLCPTEGPMLSVCSSCIRAGGDKCLDKGPGTFLHVADPCLKVNAKVSTLCSIYTPHLLEKAPSPGQLSVMELPGDAVKLSWLATALSGVLVYQIKWMPLGEGKAREVRTRGRRPFREIPMAPDPKAK